MGFLNRFAALCLLVSNALAIEIPAVPTWPSGRCTDKSLTIPSWIISRYQVSGGTTTFRITNRAAVDTGLIADIECKPDGKCHTSGIDELRGTIAKDANGNPVISLGEIWVCGDEGDKYVVSRLTYLVHSTGQNEKRRLTPLSELSSHPKAALQLPSAPAMTASLPSHILSTVASASQSHSRQPSRRLPLATMLLPALVLARINGPYQMVRMQSLPIMITSKYARYS
jgi:hypothetical protein